MQDLTPRLVVRHRFLISGVLFAITGFFGWHAARVQFDNTIESYFLPEYLEQYDRVLDQFGSDEIVVVAFEDRDVFTRENLVLIDSLTQKLRALSHLRRVLSLSSVKIVYGDKDEVYFERLVPEVLPPAEDLGIVRERALADPIVPGTLV